MLFKLKNINIIQNLILVFIFIVIAVYIIFLAINNKTYDDISKDKLLNIKIIADFEQLNMIFNNPKAEEYIQVDVEINGQTIKNCGLRTKGSSGYSLLNNSSNKFKFGYRLEFDYFNKSQNYNGIKKLYINNGIYDKTYIKEMIAFDIYEKAGVKTPQRCFGEVYINGANQGIYTIVEVPEEDFLIRNYGANYGILYKPKITAEYTPRNAESFVYIDDNIESYPSLYYCEKFGRSFTQNDAINLISYMKAFTNNENLEEYIDVQSVIDYFVVSFFIPNEDSYISRSFRNFYLYQQGKKITILPYDLNIYFIEENSVNKPVLYYNIYKDVQKNPLIYNLLSNTNYQEQYKEKMYKLIETVEDNDWLINRIDFYADLISNSIINNSNNFYDYETFKIAIETFKSTFESRIRSVKKQLDSGIWNQYIYYENQINFKLMSGL